MELRELIEAATQKLGEQRKVAELIGVHPDVLTAAKASRRGLPASACYQLAAILDLDPAVVVAASELVTEKNPEKRAVFAPFVHGIPRTAAAWILGLATTATGGIAPNDARANDTITVSSPAPEAAPMLGFDGHSIGIM